MYADVLAKYKKKNKILFSRESLCLQPLIERMQIQNHRTLVLWALDCATQTLEHFEGKYPEDQRPRRCIEMCSEWARGKVKMPIAKRAILESHAVSKSIDDPAYSALCHAVGHGGATVHVQTHALGLPFYELTAIVLENGIDDFAEPVNKKIEYYHERLLYWQNRTEIDKVTLEWAVFLLVDK